MYEEAIAEAARCITRCPAIVLGSGASIPFGLQSMTDLSNELRGSIDASELASSDRKAWAEVLDRLDSIGLEQALQEVQMREALTQIIVCKTRQLVLPKDLAVLEQLVANRNLLPLSRLFRHLFDSTHEVVSVVTTNYDRLAEYAADAIQVPHTCGFSFGYLRHRFQNSFPRIRLGGRNERMIKICKVHGSLDWFIDQNRIAISLPTVIDVPQGYMPAMVTPGALKYQETHLEPYRTTIAMADQILNDAPAFFCVGYGFNDEHIHPRIIERCRAENVPIVILAKNLTAKTIEFIESADSCNVVAFEEGLRGTRIRGSSFPEGIEVSDRSLWQLNEFLDEIM